jgi:hypothetical protein
MKIQFCGGACLPSNEFRQTEGLMGPLIRAALFIGGLFAIY